MLPNLELPQQGNLSGEEGGWGRWGGERVDVKKQSFRIEKER
jgi:hypothetical protein